MENLIIEGTHNTPEVYFKKSGEMTLKGRSLPENPSKFFEPLIEWARGFKGKELTINLNLEYFNTSTSKQLYTILEIINNNKEIQDIIVNWHYEEGDLDSLETGEHYESLFRFPFNYIEYAENF